MNKGLLEQAGAKVPVSDDINDPALDEAMEYVAQRLYEEGMDEQIAMAFDGSPVDNPENIALISYKLAQKADEVSGGEIEEENLAVLGMMTLNEVLTVAEAAGMPVKEETAAKAMKRMIIMFASDNGIPPEELQDAFGRVDDRELVAAARELPDDLDQQIGGAENPVGENIEAEIGGNRQAQQQGA